MAKRHPSLVSLSHDHHHGLALALRLRQGDKALLNDGWTHDRREQATHLQKFYQEELRPHFASEEQVLFPAMKEHIPQSVALIDSLVRQHREMEDLIRTISSAGTVDPGGLLVSFGEILEQHIRLEERELFPMYEAVMPGGIARNIQVEIDRMQIGMKMEQNESPVAKSKTQGETLDRTQTSRTADRRG